MASPSRDQMHEELLEAWSYAEMDWDYQSSWNDLRCHYHTCIRNHGDPIAIWLIPRAICPRAHPSIVRTPCMRRSADVQEEQHRRLRQTGRSVGAFITYGENFTVEAKLQ